MADQRMILARDAAITSTFMQNLPALIAALHPTKDAVLRVGAILLVKLDWQVCVFQLTAAQQAALDHQPYLISSPRDLLDALGPLDPARPSAAPYTAEDPVRRTANWFGER
ncbi:hypothetical protein [Streptomyces sp. NPDC004579]|uniref:hypothetical protein n=1 Tax=Streptomyces sp. NPDC004579 TaxID=3154667 RepID=UPI0033BE1CE3